MATRRVGDIERFVAAAYRLFSRKLATAREELAGGSYVECSFEGLIADPISELENIYVRLGLEPTDRVRAGWQDYLSRRADHRPRRYETSAAERLRILKRLGLAIA